MSERFEHSNDVTSEQDQMATKNHREDMILRQAEDTSQQGQEELEPERVPWVPQLALESLANVEQKLESLTELIKTRLGQNEAQEQVILSLHTELQTHKDGLIDQLLRPMILDMAQFHESMLMMEHGFKANNTQEIPLETFASFYEELEDILDKYEVTVFSAEKGDIFNPTEQRVVHREPTNDKSEHGQIAYTRGVGYSYKGKVLVPQKVAAYILIEETERKGDE